MSNAPDILMFNQTPEVEIASNFFLNVPIILEYGQTPLIELVKTEQAGFTTQIPIFHRDGTQLAKVKGSRLFLTDEGRKAKLTLRHPDRMTVCELDGHTLFEITRKDAAALKTQAELWTPDGVFIRANDTGAGLLNLNGDFLRVGGVTMRGCHVADCRVAIHIDPPAKVPGMPPMPQQKTGRNDACPCGSGRKFKKCCGKAS